VLNTLISNLVLFAVLVLCIESAAAPPTLILNTPRDGIQTESLRIRIAGKSSPGAKVTVNDVEMYSHPAGGFAGLVNLAPGENILHVVAQLEGEKSELSVRVVCTQPAPPDMSKTEILKDSIVPGTQLELLPGDDVEVSFMGTPHRTATFSIAGICSKIPMVEYAQRNGWSVYRGTYRIQTGETASKVPISISLSSGQASALETAGNLTIRDSRNPVIAYVSANRGIVRTAPDGAWDMIWATGIKSEVTGRIGEMLRLSMPGGKVGWIYEDAVSVLPPGTPVPRAKVGTIISKTTDYGVSIALDVAEKLPFEVKESVSPPVIELTIYGGIAETSWINRDLDGIIKELQWSQPADGVYRLRVALNQEQIWGWDAHYEEGALVLEIKRPPKLAPPPASPLSGLTVFLDAGHGGRESGAVGPTGFEEKIANLDIAKKLARKLRMKGARVVLSRTKDVTVPLEDRPSIAASANADILISIHNNSVAESSDPVKVRGVSTYWYHPHAMSLSESIYKRCLDLGIPGLGHIYSNLAIIRPHRMIAVLIEGAFMSHPDEEFLLQQDDFREKLAESIMQGVEDWLKQLRKCEE